MTEEAGRRGSRCDRSGPPSGRRACAPRPQKPTENPVVTRSAPTLALPAPRLPRKRGVAPDWPWVVLRVAQVAPRLQRKRRVAPPTARSLHAPAQAGRNTPGGGGRAELCSRFRWIFFASTIGLLASMLALDSARAATAPEPTGLPNALAAALMGLVEGLTEFLPVSSTGHLILAGHFLHYGSPAFEIVIQLGAMFALTWCYRERLTKLAQDVFRRQQARAFVAKIVLAFMPAALAGLTLGDFVESHLFRPEFVALTLVLGGVVLLVVDGPGRSGRTLDLEEVSFGQALAIGCGQTLALLPGVSRSGATIVSGLLAGLDRRVATDFSFLLALPTMYAAGGYTLLRAHKELAAEVGSGLLIGLVIAYISALVVLRAFLKFVQTNSLRPFGWYRIIVGLLIGGVFLFSN